MATRFYTEFFKDGDGKLQFEEGSEVEQSFAKTIGFNPTITTLDAFANEAIRDVGQSVESFGFLMDSGKTDGALRQLQQAFVMGEHLPPVQSVPREKKTANLRVARRRIRRSALAPWQTSLPTSEAGRLESTGRPLSH
jgi:hypothetical protein